MTYKKKLKELQKKYDELTATIDAPENEKYKMWLYEPLIPSKFNHEEQNKVAELRYLDTYRNYLWHKMYELKESVKCLKEMGCL